MRRLLFKGNALRMAASACSCRAEPSSLCRLVVLLDRGLRARLTVGGHDCRSPLGLPAPAVCLLALGAPVPAATGCFAVVAAATAAPPAMNTMHRGRPGQVACQHCMRVAARMQVLSCCRDEVLCCHGTTITISGLAGTKHGMDSHTSCALCHMALQHSCTTTHLWKQRCLQGTPGLLQAWWRLLLEPLKYAPSLLQAAPADHPACGPQHQCHA